MKKKLILITGGAGYVGSVLVKKLLDKNYKVRIIDCLFFGDQHIKEMLDKDLELIKLNLKEIENHQELLNDVDFVIHLAGLSNDPTCELNEEYTIENNIIDTKMFIELCKKKGIERFIFSSSCSVYGARGEEEIVEESPRNPISLYAKSKVEIENFIMHLADEKFSPTILRHGTIFGYSPRMRFDLIVNTMTKYALNCGEVNVIGGGKNWRPNVHVDDVAEGFVLALESPLKIVKSQIFNVGSNNMNYTVEDVAKIIVDTIPNTKLAHTGTSIDQRSYKVNFDKIEKVLGFKTKKSIQNGVLEIIKKVKEGKLDINDRTHINLEVMKELNQLPHKEGGLITRYKFLPLSIPSIENEEVKEITDALISGWITRGPKTSAFEEEIKNYCKAKYAHAVNSCTAALHLALIALDIKENDEVILPPVTFSSTANVVIHQRAIPVFVDIKKETLNIDPDKIEEKITPKTRAIITVDLAGQPCDYEKIKKIAEKHSLKIIEDAAHAIGAEYHHDKIGTISDVTCFSFYATKNMTAGEGGMLVTNNKDIYETAKLYSLHGMSKDAWKRYSTEGNPHWETLVPGYKYNMTDIQSSLGIHQLKKLDDFINIREKYTGMYNAAFKDIKEITILNKSENVKHARHLYIIMLNLEKLKMDRDKFVSLMKDKGIGTGIHFISIHLQPYYKDTFGFKDEDYPNAKFISDRIVSLPLYPKMTYYDVNNVIEAVKEIINDNKL